jgi:septal ring factor EnvC (AmiA/AmiB activator)
MLRRNWVLVLFLAALLALPPGAAAAGTRPAMQAAPPSGAAARDDLQTRLDAATRAYIESREELVGVESELREAQRQVDGYNERLADAKAVLAGQAAALYRSGGLPTASMVLGQKGGDVGDLADRLALADRVAAHSQDKAVEAGAIVAGYDAATRRLGAVRARRRSLVAKQQDAVGRLQADLAEAEERLRREDAAKRARERAAAAEKARAEAEAAREAAEAAAATTTTTTAPPTTTTRPPVQATQPKPPATSGGRACPVARPYSFIDSWGFARSGGRRHQGVDIMARHGTTVYAYMGGVVTSTTVNEGLGGTTVWIRDRSGTLYYYAHLARFVVRRGQTVRTGQVVGAVGSTGNATADAPHLHFEIRPGGTPVNPYPFVKAVCP